MASTDGNTFFQDAGKNLFGLVLDYGRHKLIDVETSRSDNNIPDRNDMANGFVPLENSNALGGAYKTGGISPVQWALLGGGLLIAAIVVKRLV